MRTRHLCLLAVVAGIAACSSVPKPETPVTAPAAPGPAPSAPPPSSSKYYLDDGPGDSVPANLDTIPDAVPRVEPLHRFANRPYSCLLYTSPSPRD